VRQPTISSAALTEQCIRWWAQSYRARIGGPTLRSRSECCRASQRLPRDACCGRPATAGRDCCSRTKPAVYSASIEAPLAALVDDQRHRARAARPHARVTERGAARHGTVFARFQLTPTAELDELQKRHAARGANDVHRHIPAGVRTRENGTRRPLALAFAWPEQSTADEASRCRSAINAEALPRQPWPPLPGERGGLSVT
jgi:hypothetical protein